MGRGRQKAKQTKIARKLKYLTTDTDYNELQRELSNEEETPQTDGIEVDAEDDEVSDLGSNDDLDDYAQWAAQAAAAAAATAAQAQKKAAPAHIPMPIPGGLIPKPAGSKGK
jgi:hypothetical protein